MFLSFIMIYLNGKLQICLKEESNHAISYEILHMD